MNRILNREFFKRDVAIALVCAVVFSVFFALTGFDTKCDQLRDRVLRLHISSRCAIDCFRLRAKCLKQPTARNRQFV